MTIAGTTDHRLWHAQEVGRGESKPVAGADPNDADGGTRGTGCTEGRCAEGLTHRVSSQVGLQRMRDDYEVTVAIARKTVLSACRTYRYALWRSWLGGEGYANFIGLNPSTADELIDDNTITRCIAFAKLWGFEALCMTNLFAFRATRPCDLRATVAPVGPDNDRYLLEMARGGRPPPDSKSVVFEAQRGRLAGAPFVSERRPDPAGLGVGLIRAERPRSPLPRRVLRDSGRPLAMTLRPLCFAACSGAPQENSAHLCGADPQTPPCGRE
jgi:Protein of unknown function (DUF1643)